MKKLLAVTAFALGIAALFCPRFTGASAGAQETPPASKASHVKITEGPALESSWETSAIVAWTSNNPGGSDEHYGVVYFGTDPRNLSAKAKSHIRLNRTHSYTVFRVRVLGLQPHTTYYYRVDSEDASGMSDKVPSPVGTFTTH
jgi:phosphodiesterase/alkaline phosphatase D-like protein